METTSRNPCIARDGERFLFHLVFLPEKKVQERAAILSAKLNEVFPNPFYKLTAEEQASPLEGDLSYPHVTFMHFWATPDEAEKSLSFLEKENRELTSLGALEITGLTMNSGLRRFLGKKGEKDVAAWLSVASTSRMLDIQERIRGCVSLGGGIPVTSTGDHWRPHITLAVSRLEDTGKGTDPLVLRFEDLFPTGAINGKLALGLSGPNGQFRVVGGEGQGYGIKRLLTFLTPK